MLAVDDDELRMKRFSCLLMAALIAVWLVSPQVRAQSDPTRVALVIGNGDYVHAAPLPNPPNDARDISAQLRALNFEVIEGVNLDRNAMEQLLRQFASRLDDGGIALFFYAGHGLQVYGRNYLVPIDAQLDEVQDLYFEAFDVNLVLRLLEEEARTSLIFLDACRDNPLARNLARTMGTGRSQAVGRGLAPVESGIGTLIAYATQPNNVALDGSGENSPFASAVLEYIDEPGLEVRQMLSRVRESVIRVTGGRQVPWDHSSLTGDFYFANERQVAARAEPSAAAPLPEPAPDPQLDIIFWQAIQNSANPEDFRAYLDKFPDGIFTPLARNRLRQLEGRAAEDEPRGETAAGVTTKEEPFDEVDVARLDDREIELERREADLRRRQEELEIEWDRRLAELDQRLATRQDQVDAELKARAESLAAKAQALLEQQERLERFQREFSEEREQAQSEIQGQLSAAESKLQAAEAERERLAQERQALEEEQVQLAALRQQNEARRSELEALSARQAERMALLERERKALEAAREELAARQRELASAPDPEEMAELKAMLDARELELGRREAQIVAEQNLVESERGDRLAALDQELERRQQAFEAELQERGTDLEQRELALRKRQQRLAELAAEVAEEKEQNEAERRAQIADAEAKLAAAAEERRRLEAEREQLDKEEAHLAALRSEAETKRAELEALAAEQAGRVALIEQDRAALERARAELARRQQDIANAPDPEELARAKAALDVRAAELQSREGALANEQRALEAERSKRLAALDLELAARQTAAERELEERAAMLEAREEALATERGKLAALEREIALDRERGEVTRQEQLAEAEAKLAAAEDERNRLAAERNQLEEERRRLAELRSRDKKRRTDLAMLEAEQAERLARLERDRAALELAQKELAEHQVKLADTPDPDEIEATRVELATREAELRRRQAELAEDQRALESQRSKQVAALDLQLEETSTDGPPPLAADAAPGRPSVALGNRHKDAEATESEPAGQKAAETAEQNAAHPGPKPDAASEATPATTPTPEVVEEETSVVDSGEVEGASEGAAVGTGAAEQVSSAESEEPRKDFTVAALDSKRDLETSSVGERPRPEPEVRLEVIDGTYVATRNSNVRGGPSTDYPVVGFLSRGTEVKVRGRVVDREWYQVVWPGVSNAYVHANLLTERNVQVARASEGGIPETADRERAAREGQAALEAAAKREAEEEVRWERERKEAAELRKAQEQLAAVQRQRDIDSVRQREQAPEPTAQLTASNLFGAWCGDGVSFRISDSSWNFRMADGFEVGFEVERVEADQDVIRVHWRDAQGRRALTEFGRFSEDGTQLVQLRGRVASASEWNYYDRSFRRC